jgi:hypothetical protein
MNNYFYNKRVNLKTRSRATLTFNMSYLLLLFLCVIFSEAAWQFPLQELNQFSMNELKEKFQTISRMASASKQTNKMPGDPVSNILNYFETLQQCESIQAVGASIIVQQNGETILKQVYGKSDRENNIDMSFDSLFSIGKFLFFTNFFSNRLRA